MERVTSGEGCLVLLAVTLVSKDHLLYGQLSPINIPPYPRRTLAVLSSKNRIAAPTLKLESKLDIGCLRGWTSTEGEIRLDTLANHIRLVHLYLQLGLYSRSPSLTFP